MRLRERENDERESLVYAKRIWKSIKIREEPKNCATTTRRNVAHAFRWEQFSLLLIYDLFTAVYFMNSQINPQLWGLADKVSMNDSLGLVPNFQPQIDHIPKARCIQHNFHFVEMVKILVFIHQRFLSFFSINMLEKLWKRERLTIINDFSSLTRQSLMISCWFTMLRHWSYNAWFHLLKQNNQKQNTMQSLIVITFDIIK